MALAPGGSGSHGSGGATPQALVSCVDAFNALFHCASPVNQGDRSYKDGALDGCARQLTELQLCLQLKVAGPERTRAIVRQLLADGAAHPPTFGVVWEPRGGEQQAAAAAAPR